jgi:pimeloyl-ACP methyl ester carboxylesterase
MRSLVEKLNTQGHWGVGLRIPGHGTVPSGLLDISWHDFTAAVRIAAKHLRNKLGPDRPLYIIGYSNGAALAVEYSLAVLEGENLPKVDALVFISPAIEVTPVAAFAIWQARLSRIFGLEKLLWNDIQPEFDPYKYNSFTVNAGYQIYQLTQNIAERLQRVSSPEGIKGFPETLAFVSVVDATIPPATLIDALFSKLAKQGHQLVLFDINRHIESELLLRSDPEILTNQLLKSDTLPFDLTLLTNTDASTNDVVVWRKSIGSNRATKQELDLVWPAHLFSLSHVALPFPIDDPIYGGQEHSDDQRINLGNVWIRGERNLLQIPDNFFIRLRYNPFFSYLQQRTLEFLENENNPVDQ